LGILFELAFIVVQSLEKAKFWLETTYDIPEEGLCVFLSFRWRKKKEIVRGEQSS